MCITSARPDFNAYQTKDPIDNEVFLVEKGGKAVILESPCFFDNIRELTDYLTARKLSRWGCWWPITGAGASFPARRAQVRHPNAVDYSAQGGGKALIDGFAAAFGDGF